MIELEGVTKVYRAGEVEVRALDGVDLTIDEGDLVAIMGPSGCGKSTMTNILGGLDVPSAGSYRLDVGLLRDNRPVRNTRIGFVFQSFKGADGERPRRRQHPRVGRRPRTTPFAPGRIGDEFTEVASGLNLGHEVLLPQAQVTTSPARGGPPSN
jgi:ABC-type oligopeptide transport system ATPase subunit